jgi:hypothetical protein
MHSPLGRSHSQRREPAPRPSEPPPDVGPDVEQVHTLLIKPGHSFDAPLETRRGDLQPRRGERTAQEVEAPADRADERLVRGCSTCNSASVWFTSRIASRSFPRVGARITQSSMNSASASQVASTRSSVGVRAPGRVAPWNIPWGYPAPNPTDRRLSIVSLRQESFAKEDETGFRGHHMDSGDTISNPRGVACELESPFASASALVLGVSGSCRSFVRE